ncbi:DMT family transporter [Pontitalea aquivivens]|uniref:DMT family transporter n=1 Tax=Pontitalea aquivivens TaxID=3388663 RepID=UPI0039710624
MTAPDRPTPHRPEPARPDQTRLSPRAWALLIGLAVLWGGAFLSNRAALTELGFFSVAALRVIGAAAVLWTYIAIRRLPVPADARLLPRFVILGGLNNAIPFALIAWGQIHIDSGLAAILNAASAIFAVLVAALAFADERLSPRKAAGVGLGFAGVVLAMGPGVLRTLDPGSLAQIAVLGASVSFALGAAYARVAIRGLVPEVAAAGMLTGGAVWLVPAMILFEGMPGFDWSGPVWAGLGWLILGCSALAYLIYYRVLALAGAGNLMLVTLLVPPVAVLAGWVAYREALSFNALAGFGVLALGLVVINGGIGGGIGRKTP